MSNTTAKVLALDLEGTLISNAMSQIPRSGLYAFLSRCAQLFPRVVMFTTVNEVRFRQIARLLVEEGVAPAWFSSIEYIAWHGDTKDLKFIPNVDPQDVWLVDDFEQYVHPGQESRWLKIDLFDYPYEETDQGLAQKLQVLEQHAAII